MTERQNIQDINYEEVTDEDEFSEPEFLGKYTGLYHKNRRFMNFLEDVLPKYLLFPVIFSAAYGYFGTQYKNAQTSDNLFQNIRNEYNHKGYVSDFTPKAKEIGEEFKVGGHAMVSSENEKKLTFVQAYDLYVVEHEKTQPSPVKHLFLDGLYGMVGTSVLFGLSLFASNRLEEELKYQHQKNLCAPENE